MLCLCTESMKNWYLSRRMFLVDTLSGREKSMSALPKVIRVASSVKIRWALNVHITIIKRESNCYGGNLCINELSFCNFIKAFANAL